MLKGRDVNGWGFQQNPDVNELIVGEIVKHGGGEEESYQLSTNMHQVCTYLNSMHFNNISKMEKRHPNNRMLARDKWTAEQKGGLVVTERKYIQYIQMREPGRIQSHKH